MYVCIFLCYMLFHVSRRLVMGKSLVQSILPDYLIEFIVSEVNSKGLISETTPIPNNDVIQSNHSSL